MRLVSLNEYFSFDIYFVISLLYIVFPNIPLRGLPVNSRDGEPNLKQNQTDLKQIYDITSKESGQIKFKTRIESGQIRDIVDTDRGKWSWRWRNAAEMENQWICRDFLEI